MTVWGLLADIHGNLPALQRALAAFQQAEVDRIAVLGDNLGRGDSDGCVRTIREVADVSVLGNRDLDWQDRVGPESRSYVLTLPRTAQAGTVLFAHGDARLTPDLSSNDIRRDFVRARTMLTATDSHICIFGHTHRARVWRISESATPALLFDAAVDPLPVRIPLATESGKATCRWFVNVGSAGLPFPGKGPASAAVLDDRIDGEGWVTFLPL